MKKRAIELVKEELTGEPEKRLFLRVTRKFLIASVCVCTLLPLARADMQMEIEKGYLLISGT